MASRMRRFVSAGVALLLVLAVQGHAPADARARRGLWRGVAEARLLAAEREGGQPPQQPPSQQPPGQQQPAYQPQPPIFRTGINFVRVDVIISDKAGNPIADLQPADFDISEDG